MNLLDTFRCRRFLNKAFAGEYPWRAASMHHNADMAFARVDGTEAIIRESVRAGPDIGRLARKRRRARAKATAPS